MDPIKVDFTGGAGDKQAKGPVIPPAKAGLRILINVVVTLVVAAITYYVMLPPLNFKATELYMYLGIVLVTYCVVAFLTSGAFKRPEMMPYVKRQATVPVVLIGLLVVVVLIGTVISSVVFRAKSYQELMPVETKNFAEDVKEADFSTVPVLDNDSVKMLGDRQLGTLQEFISQFKVNDAGYSQINYQNRPVKVTTLQYADIIKWFTNRKEGLPAYIVVDLVSQKVDVVKTEEGKGIKYSTAEHFGRLLQRHLRFSYPTYLFDTPHFEINEAGDPYWICPRIDKTIGLFGGEDVIGIVLVNAVTGECQEYDMDAVRGNAELQWIDGVYSPTLLTQQFNYHGKYQNGFINSLIGQRDVMVTTEGNNFLAIDDDVYFYTGITSITSDQSIVGFTLINQRTKEAVFYPQAGAKETSAQASAQGKVQQYSYKATFPLLLNISDQPTYFMALKDASSLVKMYAMVNVKEYSTVIATGASIKECTQNYVQLLRDNGIEASDVVVDEDPGAQPDTSATKDLTGVITEIRTAVRDGNSYYYIRLRDDSTYYAVSAGSVEDVVILNVGDTVTLTVPAESEGAIIPADAVGRATA